MDERRDLVDREELRRRIKANESAYDAWSYRNAMHLLDAMPSVEQPVGMTRDDVLAALDAAADRGDEAVVEYLDTSIGKWYGTNLYNWINPEVPRLNVRVRVTEQAPEKVPLTQLVGRTIAGEDDVVTYEPTHHTGRWWWQGAGGSWRVFPEGTLNLETGQVAVRPKAAT
jgi:hypothetical protein